MPSRQVNRSIWNYSPSTTYPRFFLLSFRLSWGCTTTHMFQGHDFWKKNYPKPIVVPNKSRINNCFATPDTIWKQLKNEWLRWQKYWDQIPMTHLQIKGLEKRGDCQYKFHSKVWSPCHLFRRPICFIEDPFSLSLDGNRMPQPVQAGLLLIVPWYFYVVVVVKTLE